MSTPNARRLQTGTKSTNPRRASLQGEIWQGGRSRVINDDAGGFCKDTHLFHDAAHPEACPKFKSPPYRPVRGWWAAQRRNLRQGSGRYAAPQLHGTWAMYAGAAFISRSVSVSTALGLTNSLSIGEYRLTPMHSGSNCTRWVGDGFSGVSQL